MLTGTTNRVQSGAERLAADPTLVDGARLGLVTNYTAVLPDLRTDITVLREAGVALVALFGPEHGLWGTAQAGESEPDAHDPGSGLPLYDTYRIVGTDLERLLVDSGVDTVVYDLQDIGTRFYTYIWTMYDLMVAAARVDVAFVVLDRPNPIGGRTSEGPPLDPAFASFVGRAPIPLRHGLTVGELARHLNAAAVPEAAGRPVSLDVVAMEGWSRDLYADQTGLPWVMPSVNIPTLDSALLYPGTGLFEGTNLSEGRGTTRPFELIGAPWVDARWAAALNERDLPGVRFRDVAFTPTYHKHTGVRLRGIQPYVLDRNVFAPVRTALTMLSTVRELYPSEFGWREAEGGAGATVHKHFIDLLWGSDALRRTLDAGEDPASLLEASSHRAPTSWAGAALLYRNF